MKRTYRLVAALAAFLVGIVALLPAFLQAEEALACVELYAEGEGFVEVFHQEQSLGRAENGETIQFEIPTGGELVLQIQAGSNGHIERISRQGQEIPLESLELNEQKAAGRISVQAQRQEHFHIVFSRNNFQESRVAEIDLPMKRSLPTGEEREILAAYLQGKEADYRDARLQKARELGLERWIDEQGFLIPAFFETYDSMLLKWDGGFILSRHMLPENRSVIEAALEKQENLRKQYPKQTLLSPGHSRQMMEVAGKEDLGWVSVNNGGALSNSIWQLSNGAFAFCAEGMHAGPQVGMQTHEPVRQDNENLRKALFYGYLGPGNILEAKGWSREAQIVITNELVSNAYCGTCSSKVGADGYNWKYTIEPIWNEIMNLPDPEGYSVYTVYVPGSGTNWQGEVKPIQTLAYGEWTPKGSFYLQKRSSTENVSQNNENYSFANAQYDIFQGEQFETATRIHTLVLNEEGKSPELEVETGVYWALETKAPQGFVLNEEPVRFEVKQSASTSVALEVSVIDHPQYDRPELLLMKNDAGPNGSTASLAGAQFEMNFYALRAENIDSFDPQQHQPDRSWVMQTDEQGQILLDEAYKISGPDFYTSRNQEPCFPLGIVTFQEIRAPEGYLLNPERFAVRISSENDQENVQVFQPVTVLEQPVELIILKKQKDTSIGLPGARFEHVLPDGGIELLESDEEGKIHLTHLPFGSHSITEVQAPDGYVPLQETIRFEVSETGIVMEKNQGDGFVYEPQTGSLLIEDATRPWSLRLRKVNDHDSLLDGAEFGLYADEECTRLIEKQVSHNGLLEFTGLENGTLVYLKEEQAPDGYRLPVNEQGNPVVISIRANLIPVQDRWEFEVNDALCNVNTPIPGGWVQVQENSATLELTVVNQSLPVLPETGNLKTGGALLTVTACCGAGWMMSHSKKRENKKRKMEKEDE